MVLTCCDVQGNERDDGARVVLEQVLERVPDEPGKRQQLRE